MSDDPHPPADDGLDDRLAGLDDMAVPALLPAAAVRARGERRRRWTRSTGAAAAAASAVLVIGGGYALVGGEPARDALRVADQPSPTPSPDPSPSESASPSPTTSPSPSASPSPGPSPSLTSAATAAAPAGWKPEAAFLPPDQASRAEEPGWGVTTPYEPEAGPLLDPCRGGRFPRAESLEASAEREMTRQKEEDSAQLTQEAFRYSSAAAAEASYADYLEQVRRCPDRPSEQAPDQFTRYDIVEQSERGGVVQALVRARACNPACGDLYTGYYAVVRHRDGVMTLAYGIGVDGDPADSARALLSAAADAFAQGVRG